MRLTLRVRWLGRVRYQDASALQHALVLGDEDHLLLLEHPHVYTLGVRAKQEHVLPSASASGAEIVRADRGGDVTYHGPGQLVAYPILGIPTGSGSVPAYVHRIERLVIDVLTDLGLRGAGRLASYPGVWVDPQSENPRKICAIGVRVERGRSMHGLALNVDPDLGMFDHIVPCGIPDKAVTSLAHEGVHVTMAEVVDAVARRAARGFAFGAEPRAVERPSPCGRSSVASLRRGSTSEHRSRSVSGSPNTSVHRSGSDPRSSASARRCASSGSSPCVKRLGARTSRSAGPTGRPRS
jgi:lipoic acid synthetase